MKVAYLKEFIHLCEVKNFSVAAEDLYISQSCLSKHMAALEKELGAMLFHRDRKETRPTPLGLSILEEAILIVKASEAIDMKVLGYLKDAGQILRIASIPVMAQYGITRLISSYRQNHPQTQVIISTMEGSEIHSAVLKDQYDVGFVRLFDHKDRHPELSYQLFSHDHFILLVADDHPLNQGNPVELKALSQEIFLLLDKKTNLYQPAVEACRRAGFTPNIAYTGNRVENIIEMVKDHVGIAMLMAKQVAYFNLEGVKAIDFKPHTSGNLYLCTKKVTSHSKAVRNFIDNL